MSKVQVLVACMRQTDDSLYRKMNLQTDAVLANQCGNYEYREFTEPDGNLVQLVSTADRGVGKNRNKALLFASGEYLLCSDQDMVYADGYAEIVEKAFKDCPRADIIVFRLEYMNRFTKAKEEASGFRRVHLFNCMRYGTARVAIRKSAIEKACLSFSVLYGGGARFASGEDSLFIREAFRKGLKMYTCPDVIAKVKQEESSWFKGYNDKFFIDKGVLVANAFPVLGNLFMFYFAYGLKKVSKDYGFFKICRLMRQGIRDFKKL